MSRWETTDGPGGPQTWPSLDEAFRAIDTMAQSGYAPPGGAWRLLCPDTLAVEPTTSISWPPGLQVHVASVSRTGRTVVMVDDRQFLGPRPSARPFVSLDGPAGGLAPLLTFENLDFVLHQDHALPVARRAGGPRAERLPTWGILVGSRALLEVLNCSARPSGWGGSTGSRGNARFVTTSGVESGFVLDGCAVAGFEEAIFASDPDRSQQGQAIGPTVEILESAIQWSGTGAVLSDLGAGWRVASSVFYQCDVGLDTAWTRPPGRVSDGALLALAELEDTRFSNCTLGLRLEYGPLAMESDPPEERALRVQIDRCEFTGQAIRDDDLAYLGPTGIGEAVLDPLDGVVGAAIYWSPPRTLVTEGGGFIVHNSVAVTNSVFHTLDTGIYLDPLDVQGQHGRLQVDRCTLLDCSLRCVFVGGDREQWSIPDGDAGGLARAPRLLVSNCILVGDPAVRRRAQTFVDHPYRLFGGIEFLHGTGRNEFARIPSEEPDPSLTPHAANGNWFVVAASLLHGFRYTDKGDAQGTLEGVTDLWILNNVFFRLRVENGWEPTGTFVDGDHRHQPTFQEVAAGLPSVKWENPLGVLPNVTLGDEWELRNDPKLSMRGFRPFTPQAGSDAIGASLPDRFLSELWPQVNALWQWRYFYRVGVRRPESDLYLRPRPAFDATDFSSATAVGAVESSSGDE